MSAKTMIDRIEQTEFSERQISNFLNLTHPSNDQADEDVIIAAAAALIARRHVTPGQDADMAVVREGSEFIRLMMLMRERSGIAGPVTHLRVVGGFDA